MNALRQLVKRSLEDAGLDYCENWDNHTFFVLFRKDNLKWVVMVKLFRNPLCLVVRALHEIHIVQVQKARTEIMLLMDYLNSRLSLGTFEIASTGKLIAFGHGISFDKAKVLERKVSRPLWELINLCNENLLLYLPAIQAVASGMPADSVPVSMN